MRTNKQTLRFVSWVLTLAMVLGLLAGTTVGVSAKLAPVAEVWSPDMQTRINEYSSLADAFEAANTTGEYAGVFLLKDVTVNEDLALTNDINLFLNDHTLTISSSGSITGSSECIDIFGSTGGAIGGSIISSGIIEPSLNIEGKNISVDFNGGEVNGTTMLYSGTVNISGGTVVYIQSWGDVNISGGIVCSLGPENGTTTITGGTIGAIDMMNNDGTPTLNISDSPTISDELLLEFYGGGQYCGLANVTISGSPKIKAVGLVFECFGQDEDDGEGLWGTIVIDGGYFGNDPKANYDSRAEQRKNHINATISAIEEYKNQTDWAADPAVYGYRVGGSGSSDPVDATSIDIEEAVLELAPGDTQKLTLSVVPADAAVSWESNNESVASVSSDGTVTAVTDGTALITARSHNDLTATCPVTVKTPAHTHDLSYTADGATITASCSAVGCTLTQGKATLKVVPPEESAYDTKARTATLDISDESVFKNATIIYKKGDVELDAAPKDAGEYKATVTFGGVTAEASFAITMATPTISLADKTMDYNGSPAALQATVTLLGDDTNTAETTYNYYSDQACSSSIDVPTIPGEYYAKATIAEQDNYTAATSAAAKVTIKQAPVKISGITAESRMYKEDDKSATLVTDSAIIEGVVQGETVSFTVEGIFDDDAIGQDKKVTLTGYALIGPDSAKYALHPDCQKETTANIMGAEVASVTSASITTTGAVISAETTEAQTAAESAVNAIASNGVAAAETSSQKGLTEAAEDIAADSTVLDAARETASNSGITVSESNPLQVIPRLDAQVKEVTAEGSSVSSITLEMKGMYSVVAKNDPGTVLAEGEMQVNGIVPMEVAVPWADGFAWVRHDHQGNILNYKATVTSGVAGFTSTQGCSEFVLSQETDSVAYIKNSGVEQYYNAFDKALDDIASSDDNTIYLVDNVTATVSKEVTFIVSKGGFTCTLTAGTNYEMTTSGTDPVTYTFTYHAPQTTGGGDGSSAKTETVQNADGSTTTTTTNADGSKVAVTKAANGTTVTVNMDKNGNVTSVAANVSAQAAQDAAKTGDAVALPGTIAKGQNVKVTVPAGSDVKVAIPVSGANAGTVLYAVDASGNKTLIKDTAYENGKLVVDVKQTATLVAQDNAKSFADVTSGRWSKNAVDFVTARELFNGTGATTFGPTETMTRGMLMTVLARYEGVDAYGSDWMEKGMAWSVSKGISYGSEPNRPITRQEIVTMMWRLAGSPVAGAQAASVLAAKPDGAKVADWAQAAMAWALENKVMNGNDKGYVNPESPATREEVAQFLMNYICR